MTYFLRILWGIIILTLSIPLMAVIMLAAGIGELLNSASNKFNK